MTGRLKESGPVGEVSAQLNAMLRDTQDLGTQIILMLLTLMAWKTLR